MTGQEKILEVMMQVAEIKQKIQDKYDKVMSRIVELHRKLAEFENQMNNPINHTLQWIEKQKQKIRSKIMELTQNITQWLNDQMAKAQNWMSGIKEEIMNYIAELLLAPVKALVGI